jgi:hypothetical protein
MLHSLNFLSPVALGRGTKSRFVTLVVGPYSSIENLESNFFCFGGKVREGQNFERIYKGLPFRDIYPVPLPSAKCRWSAHFLMQVMLKKLFICLTNVIIFTKEKGKGGDCHRCFV